jgi:AmmeMemoRadiSam system protein B
MIISDVRPSSIAGTWYEGEPELLKKAVDDFINKANIPELPGEVMAIIVPHAGHRFSGAVAGHAFSALKGCLPDVVAVISPMHHLYSHPFLTTAHRAYSTPLGEISVNRLLLDELDKKIQHSLGVGLTKVANDPEHSLEIELPFLQRIIKKEFSLIPLMLCQQTPKSAKMLGVALAEILKGKNFLLVASTDLSHFHKQLVANSMDKAMLDQVKAFAPEGIFEIEAEGKGEACGLGALAAVLWAAKALGANCVKILDYATSGDVTGDYQSVVGYGAAVVLKTK